jgi:hypothetical protein
LPLESLTIAANCAPKAVLITALCGVPPVGAIDVGPPPAPTTVTVAVISGMNGGELARITAVPGAKPVTRNTTVANALPSGYIVMLGGTAATLGLEELSFTKTPAPGPQRLPSPHGAGSDNAMKSLCDVPCWIVIAVGENVSVAGIVTTWLAVS